MFSYVLRLLFVANLQPTSFNITEEMENTTNALFLQLWITQWFSKWGPGIQEVQPVCPLSNLLYLGVQAPHSGQLGPNMFCQWKFQE